MFKKGWKEDVMKKVLLSCVLVLAMSGIVSADTVRGIDIDFVTIGNAGNAGDTRTDYPDSAEPYGCGAVGYEFRMGQYEITNAQWNAFVAAAGAPTGNDGGYSYSAYWTGANIPTNEVSWYEATQFCNFLTSGDKSKGAYLFSGSNSNPGDFLGIDRDLSISTYGTTYVIPTEDEWYKAAYFKPNASGYSTYANGLNTIPAADDGWNYLGGAYSSPWNVGTGGIAEQNGTFDMMGNVYEWNETLIFPSRGIRGGSYDTIAIGLNSSERSYSYPYYEFSIVGFRVACVPEPASVLFLTGGMWALMRRKASRK
jgi:formylglycine-generating enzyme required for sulfatase activity